MTNVLQTFGRMLTQLFDPRGRPTVSAGNDHCFCTCRPFARSSPLFKSKRMFTTGETVGLAEWIIDDTCSLFFSKVDSSHIEAKIFPRSAALAERLWSNPSEKWYKAEQRMLEHRNRLVKRGIRADALQPEWCRINEGQCYWKDDYHLKEENDQN